MKKTYKYFINLMLLFGIAAGILTGCNENSSQSIGGTANGASAYFKGQKLVGNEQSLPMDLRWSLDGMPINSTGRTVNDMAWHLLTLTVVDQSQPLPTPVALKGLQFEIDPIPINNRGESVAIEDINCDTALFQKNGDTCSAYIRVTYNTSTGIDNPPVIGVNVVTNAYPYLSGMLSIAVRPLLKMAQGDYRVVLPIESKYYVGSALVSNPNQYQIIDMKNISLPPLTITQISPINNTTFTLINRQSADGSDPYYGPFSQCSLTANPGLNQVNSLPNLDSECILIYKASNASTQTIESANVSLATDAYITSPWTINTLELTANYITGKPIPENIENGSSFIVTSGSAVNSGTSKVMTNKGTLSSGSITPSSDPFNLVNISYNFIPEKIGAAPYGIPYYQDGVLNVIDPVYSPTSNEKPTCPVGKMCPAVVQTPYEPSIKPGQQILTDASSTNPVTIGTVTAFASIGNGTGSYSGNWNVGACGGASVTTNVSITPEMGEFGPFAHLHMKNSSNGHCGGTGSANYDIDVPAGTLAQQTVFDLNDRGCAGGNWNMGGSVAISKPYCNSGNDTCVIVVSLTANHGGVGGQCQETKTQSFGLNYKNPKAYLQLYNLGNFHLQTTSPSIVGFYRQSSNATLGSQNGPIAQAVSCSYKDKVCTASGLYSNGLSSTSMSYNINLNGGDTLYNGNVNFTRSDGYDLSSFIISH